MSVVLKDIKMSMLLDFYGNMLTDAQRESINYYHNLDMSLSEIAEHCGISRQGARDNIKNAESSLSEFEEKLGLMKEYHAMLENVQKIINFAEEINLYNSKFCFSQEIGERSREIVKTAQEILA